MFDFDKEYIFCKRQLSSRTFIDEFGKQTTEPLFLAIPIERGIVKKVSDFGVLLVDGMILTFRDFDFAVAVEEKKEEKK